MRASEEHHEHNGKTGRLIAEIEKRRSQMEALAIAESGSDALQYGGPIVTSNPDLVSAFQAYSNSVKELNDHIGNGPDPVRNYRVLSLEGSILAEFTVNYEMAPLTASKKMADEQVSRYALQEQLPDGSWVSYYPSHDGRI